MSDYSKMKSCGNENDCFKNNEPAIVFLPHAVIGNVIPPYVPYVPCKKARKGEYKVMKKRN